MAGNRRETLDASLNYPNIASIYGVEEGALILEPVEGPTVADHIAREPLPLDESLAKAMAGETAPGDPAVSPTITMS